MKADTGACPSDDSGEQKLGQIKCERCHRDLGLSRVAGVCQRGKLRQLRWQTVPRKSCRNEGGLSDLPR